MYKRETTIMTSSETEKLVKNPLPVTDSKQFDMFSSFIANNDAGVSNTIDLWEGIPKYFFTPLQVQKLRTKDGHANPYEYAYTHNGVESVVSIQPALLKQADGKYKAFFPGVTEELIEEALKKILVDQRGRHDAENVETWVAFSLSQIQKNLKDKGRGRDLNQIKHALLVMSRCVITLYQGGQEVWTGSILQDFVGVTRDQYLDDTDKLHFARLPALISYAINQLQYRQYNYHRLMRLDEQVSRWIYKHLIHKYIQASFSNNYHFLFSTVMNSGLLQQGRMIDNRRKVQLALDALVEQDVIRTYQVDLRKQGRKVVDVKYTLWPGGAFVAEQKAANKRMTLASQRLASPVDGQ